MLRFLRKLIPEHSPVRLMYHKLMAVLAAVYYGFPAGHMTVIAVTGTNGKTTTVNMLASILQEAGKRVGVSSSIYFQIVDQKWRNDTKQTTVGRFALQKLLRQMKDLNCEYAIVESTSHAAVQYRLWGINIDTAVLTNLSKDHIEYHGSFERYRAAKGKIFNSLNLHSRKPNVKKMSILNKDDEHFEYFEKFFVDRMLTYSLKGKGSEVWADNIQFEPDKTVFDLNISNDKIQIILKVPGKFNLYNALAAAATAIAHDVGLPAIKSGLTKFEGVPGRMEVIDEGQNFNIIIDYAHTSDALEGLCAWFKPITKGKLIVVFGATGGGRDKSKRPKMGEAVEKYADLMIITNDDPYNENQFGIIEQIDKGVKRKEGEGKWKIVDRREAIRLALMLSEKDDTVLIAGKGGERVIAMGDKLIPWSDSEVVKEELDQC